MIIDFTQAEDLILSFSRGFVGWDYQDIDVKDLPLKDLKSMEALMNNAVLEIHRELINRGH